MVKRSRKYEGLTWRKTSKAVCIKKLFDWQPVQFDDMLNTCDLRCVLKVENVRDRRISTGRLFQARAPSMCVPFVRNDW